MKKLRLIKITVGPGCRKVEKSSNKVFNNSTNYFE